MPWQVNLEEEGSLPAGLQELTDRINELMQRPHQVVIANVDAAELQARIAEMVQQAVNQAGAPDHQLRDEMTQLRQRVEQLEARFRGSFTIPWRNPPAQPPAPPANP